MDFNVMLRAIIDRIKYSQLSIRQKTSYQTEIDKVLVKSVNNLIKNHENLEQHSTDKNAIEKICSQLATDGFVILPRVLTGELLDQLGTEFHEIIAHADELPYRVDKHDGGTCVRLINKSRNELHKYPATSAFFNSEVLKKIAKAYYNDNNKILFNTEIFVHETPETDSPLSGAIHWDRAQTLKFWIYIDDVPLEAGPMQVEKGSLMQNKSERIYKHEHKGKLVGGVDNILEVEQDNVVPLTAPAGSVIIHDTDASHGATPVKSGFIRRIMRGHTRAK